MSDLGAIFHVRSNGTRYDAHAYTTTDECPEPNLKINFKGTTAFVKLESKGSGNVPCYVKGSEGEYQVITSAVPTGSFSLSITGTDVNYRDFTIPKGVKILKVRASITPGSDSHATISGKDYGYVGVTPGKTYRIGIKCTKNRKSGMWHLEVGRLNNKTWIYGRPTSEGEENKCTISWSPEINVQTPKLTDY